MFRISTTREQEAALLDGKYELPFVHSVSKMELVFLPLCGCLLAG